MEQRRFFLNLDILEVKASFIPLIMKRCTILFIIFCLATPIILFDFHWILGVLYICGLVVVQRIRLAKPLLVINEKGIEKMFFLNNSIFISWSWIVRWYTEERGQNIRGESKAYVIEIFLSKYEKLPEKLKVLADNNQPFQIIADTNPIAVEEIRSVMNRFLNK